MNDTTQTPGDDTPGTTPDRTIGDWIRIADRLTTRGVAAALAEHDSDLREWMALRVLAGDIDAPHLARRLAGAGRHLHPYAERGWITETADGWTLTDEGRAAKDDLDLVVARARERATEGISPDDLATTAATLEAIVRHLGGDGQQPEPGPGFGFDPRRFGRGFGPSGRGFGPGWGFGHGRHGHDGDACDHGRARGHGGKGHRHEGHRHEGHRSGRDTGKRERAYERGFEAGFTAAERSSAR